MSSLPPDPWQVLGVSKSADKSEIRSAYRKLVLKCHPDKVQDLTLKAQKQDEFQKVQQAYELLNDDNERIKYEEQVRIHELRKKMASKAMPNTSASRTPPSKHFSFEVRTPSDTRYKASPQSTPGPTKIYAQYSSHTRSHEDASRAYEVFEAVPKSARRTASTEYPKSSRRDRDRDDDRRDREKEERRRRKEEEERERERMERARKEAKKRTEKERKSASEEKSRRHREPYVEKFPEDVEEVYMASSKPEKKKSSSSKKHDDGRERERSTRRGESPKAEKLEPRKQKTNEYIEYAANYIERSKAAKASQSSSYYPPLAPSPPPMDTFEESIHRSSARAASARRMSNDTPKKEKSSSRRQSSREDFDVVDASPRPPTLSKSHTTPLNHMASGSPPRPSRSNTESFTRTMPQPPTFSRSNTWAHAEDDRTSRNTYTIPAPVYEYESEEEHPRRSHRSSRRSPEAVRYKVGDDNKTSKIDAQYAAYGDSPSSRRYAVPLGRSPPNGYGEAPLKVKTAPSYSVDDVKFTNVAHNAPAAAYSYQAADLRAY